MMLGRNSPRNRLHLFQIHRNLPTGRRSSGKSYFSLGGSYTVANVMSAKVVVSKPMLNSAKVTSNVNAESHIERSLL